MQKSYRTSIWPWIKSSMTFVHLVAASCGGRLFPQSAITALPSLGRWCGIGFGLATHLLFAFTVWHLIWFLAGHAPTDVSREGGIAGVSGSFGKPLLQTIGLDALLAIIFAVPHSLLLLPSVRRWLTGCGIASAMYGCFYCVVTCIVLLITILCWQPSDLIVWGWPRALRPWITAAFVCSWGLLLSSLHLTGLGYQTGWTPWWRWVRGLPPVRREFTQRGAYRFLRHPVYISFLALVWLTPVVTLDRAVLIVIWTAYIFIGSALKDRRLVLLIGQQYREYQSRVPGYPGMPAGPLARVPLMPHTSR